MPVHGTWNWHVKSNHCAGVQMIRALARRCRIQHEQVQASLALGAGPLQQPEGPGFKRVRARVVHDQEDLARPSR